MFSNIAKVKNSTLRKDRCFINYGIRPYYKSLLIDQIKMSEYLASFD